MALSDPNAMQPWSWVPPEWQQPDPLSVTAPEYGAPVVGSIPLPPPPPPPPPPPQQLGPVGMPAQVEELPQPILSEPIDPTAAQEIEMPVDYVGAPLGPVGQPMPDMPAMPDAVSGVNAMPLPTDMPAPLGPMPTPVPQPRSGDNGQTSLTEDELLRLYQRDPVAFAAYNEQQNAQRDNEMRSREAEMAKQQAVRAEQDWNDYQKAKLESDAMLKQLDADAAALASEKPTKYEPGLADLAAAVLGMIGAPATGGQNVGLGMVQNRIEQHAQQQRDEYNRKKDLIGFRQNTYARLRAAGYDDFQATNAFRMASYARAKEQLLTEMQNYDPQGTTARRIAGAAIQMDAQIKQAQIAGRKADMDRRMSEAELRKKSADALIAEKKAGLLGGSGGGSVKPGNLSADEVQAMLPPDAPRVPVRPGGYTAQQAKQHVDLFKASREVKGFEDDQQRKEKAEVRELGVGGPSGEPLTNKDGQPFVARNAAVAEKLTKQANAAREVADIIDEVIAIRERSGGESKVFNSDDRQRLDVLQDRLVILEKGGTEGMSSEEDMKKLSNAIGASDVASFRSRSAGLEKGRERTVGFLNQTLRSNQYTGDPIKVPNRFNLPKPKPTATEDITSRAMQAPYVKGDPSSPIDAANTGTPAQKKLNASYETDVKTLAAYAESGDERTKQAAREALDKLAQGHPTEEGRAYAAAALKAVPGTAPVRER